MKKLIITISIVLLFTFVFLFAFRGCAYATDAVSSEYSENQTSIEDTTEGQAVEEKFDIKVYIQEKIVPVATAIIAAVIMILCALKPLISAVAAIRNMIKAFSKKDEERNESQKESNRIIQSHVSQIQESTRSIPVMEAKIEKLGALCLTTAKMVSLFMQSSPELVKSGKAKKAELLLTEMSNVIGDGKNE